MEDFLPCFGAAAFCAGRFAFDQTLARLCSEYAISRKTGYNGIRVEFTRRARPGDNAAHEQMHGRYKAETLDPPAADRRAQQRRTDRWRHDYNHHRPHEALGQKPPDRAYAPSKRGWPQSLPALGYPQSFSTRRVRPHGDIKWQGRLRFIGRAFVGETLGLKALSV